MEPSVFVDPYFDLFEPADNQTVVQKSCCMTDHPLTSIALQLQRCMMCVTVKSRIYTLTNCTLQLFIRMVSTLSAPILRHYLPEFDAPHSTPFTQVSAEVDLLGGVDTIAQPFPVLRADRPALLVSSTSWTPDEDFAVLLKALTIYDTNAKVAGGKLPKVLTIVTGKGPDQEKYMTQVQKLQGGDESQKSTWTHVRLISLWLEASDYPLLLGRILESHRSS